MGHGTHPTISAAKTCFCSEKKVSFYYNASRDGVLTIMQANISKDRLQSI